MNYEEIWKILKEKALRDEEMDFYYEMERLEKQKDPQQSDLTNVQVCPSCNKMLNAKFPPGITVGRCPYCNTDVKLSSSGELILFSLGNEKQRRPTAFAIKQDINELREIYPLIRREFEQMENQYRNSCQKNAQSKKKLRMYEL